MRKIIIISFISLVANTVMIAQLLTKAKIENINARIVSEKIEISFSITNTAKDENVDIEIKFQSGDKFIYPKSISGSTSMLTTGNYTIVWDVLKDLEQLEGEIKPIITITETTFKQNAHNGLVPGFNNANKVIATISYACLVTGTIQYFKAKSNYNNYKNELENSDSRASYYDKAVGSKSKSMILLGAGVGLLATNMILARVYNKKYNLASISYSNGVICLNYIHTFHY